MNQGIFPFPLGISSMSRPSSQGGGQAAYMIRTVLPLSASGVFTVPANGKLVYMLQAAAGSGGAVGNNSSLRMATGAGAGERVVDIVDCKAGEVFTVTLGAPGALVSAVSAVTQGNNASNSTVVSTNGYSCTIVGGKGGAAAITGTSLAGGLGGSGGSGGSSNIIRMAGSRGGNITNATGVSCTGGGAPNAMGLPVDATRGGDISIGAASLATGGGGVGGQGGDITSVSVTATGGGGSGGSAVNNAATAGRNIKGQAQTASPTDVVQMLAQFLLDMYGGGSDGGAATLSGAGAGSGANAAGSSGNCGNFGASGGANNPGGGTTVSGVPGIGAGSGGSSTIGATTCNASAGGAAFGVFYILTPM